MTCKELCIHSTLICSTPIERRCSLSILAKWSSGALCEATADSKLAAKLEKLHECFDCGKKKALREYAPSIIKDVLRPRSTNNRGGVNAERYRCLTCQYPQCDGLPGKPCLSKNQVLYYPPTPSLYHAGKYLCVECRFPACACGALRPRRTQTLQSGDREYHSEYNVFKKPTWKCCQCDANAQRVRCSSCGEQQ